VQLGFDYQWSLLLKLHRPLLYLYLQLRWLLLVLLQKHCHWRLQLLRRRAML
jgi:hypothetical protein